MARRSGPPAPVRAGAAAPETSGRISPGGRTFASVSTVALAAPKGEPVEERLRLSREAELILTPDALRLLQRGQSPRDFPLLPSALLQLRRARWGARLEIGAEVFRLSRRQTARAERLLAIARLRAQARATLPPRALPSIASDNLAQAALCAVLQPQEVAVVFGRLRGREARGLRRYLLLSDQRIACVGVRSSGTLRPAEPWTWTERASWTPQLPASLRWLATLEARSPRELCEACLATELQQLGPPPALTVALPGTQIPPPLIPRLAIAECRLDLYRSAPSERPSAPPSEVAEAWLQCARLQPLEPRWLLHLGDAHPDPALRRRAKRAHSLLCQSLATSVSDSDPPLRSPSPLSGEELQSLLHSEPAKATAQRVGEWIARQWTPELDTLRQFCERARDRDAPLLRAVDRAATLLGLGHVEVFISRGNHDVGIRALATKPPSLLVGGEHLANGSRYFLRPRELAFAVGAELAQGRLGNRRVGPRDLLRGSLSKSKLGLDLALSVIPVLSGLRLANKVGVMTAKLAVPEVLRTLEAARRVPQQFADGDRPRSELSVPNETLVGGGHALQWGADRAGLVLCEGLEAAVLAIMKTRNAYVRASVDLDDGGLLQALKRQSPGSRAAFADLEQRVALLISFYLSEQYARLVESA